MDILIDTNLILDVLQEREPWARNSTKILQECVRQRQKGYLSAHSITDLFFVLRKTHDVAMRKKIVFFLCNYFTVIAESKDDFIAVASHPMMDDLEDGLQIRCAEKYSLDYIITRNAKDFRTSKVPAITPEDFLILGMDGVS